MTLTAPVRARLEGNLRRFILFRLFYSARFYYPVLTVLFLDYGLSLEQFGLLNLVWALSIVVAEVPSGAMADVFGRKRLVVFAAVLMVIEMALLVLVPIGASPVLFTVFLLNRICSGFSEAAASGADEALAYDSLKALGREKEWAPLLEKTSRVVAVGFFSTMIIGAFVYDSALLNGALGYLRESWQLSEDSIIRLPIVLTLLSAVVVLFTTLGMYDIDRDDLAQARVSVGSNWSVVRDAFAQIYVAARWTAGHQFVLFVILAALALDSVARQFVVLASEYYRLIDIPVSWFGVIGAAMSLLGIVSARLARVMVDRLSPAQNFLGLAAILLISLWGLTLALPYWGVGFAMGCFLILGMVQFQTSFYLNREVDSKIRATVLSFRGLALNLGLGFASLFYTAWIGVLKRAQDTVMTAEQLEERVFMEALHGFPFYFIFLGLAVLLLARLLYGRRDVFFVRPRAGG